MVQGCLALIDRSLAQGLPTGLSCRAPCGPFADHPRRRPSRGAMEIDAIDRGMRPWWESLSQAQRDRTMCWCWGPKMPRAVAWPTATLSICSVGGGRASVVYAEGVFDEKAADALLATLTRTGACGPISSPTSAA